MLTPRAVIFNCENLYVLTAAKLEGERERERERERARKKIGQVTIVTERHPEFIETCGRDKDPILKPVLVESTL